MTKNYFIYLILVQTLITVQCFDIEENYFTNLNIINGLVFPSELDVMVDEEVFVKIIEPMENQKNCYYRKPGEKDIDVKLAKDNITPWESETCGIHIKGVKLSDGGYWRLTSATSAENDVSRGIVLIRVKEKPKTTTSVTTNVYSPSNYVSPKDTTYCYVLRPNQPKSEFPEHEKCKFPEIGKELDANGVWHVVTGVKGKTEELVFEVNVQAKVEQLVTSINHDKTNNSLFMKCSLKNTEKEIKFCRFLRLIDDVGLNLDEGHGTTKYRYYGNGFESGECGLEIVNPENNDKTTWKCYLGVEEDQEPLTIGALLDASSKPQKLSDGITSEDVFGLHNTVVNILCKSNAAADYCWFRHPTGQKISVSDIKEHSEEDEYRYHGTGVKLGECGISIMGATLNDSGVWSCHMGTIGEAGPEASKEISVRISESNMVSAQIFHEVRADAALVIECTTVPPHLPIDYCRFVLPDGTGFSINEKATSLNMVLGNYYFHPNRKMNLGHCSIVVRKATGKHSGQWTCAGRLVGREHESWDDFRVNVFESELSAAAISGMVLGAVFILCATLVVGYLTYKRNYRGFDTSARHQPNRCSTTSSSSSEIEMRGI